VLTPRLSGKVVGTPLTHYSLARYIAEVLHVPALQKSARARDMRRAFGL
jgi:acid phosphatase